MTHCPICYTESRTWKTIFGYTIDECSGCAHRFLASALSANHIEKIYSDEYFFGGGAGYSNYLEQARLLRSRGRNYGTMMNRIARKFSSDTRDLMQPQKRSMIDVGAAAGFLLEGWLESGWAGVGIEPNRTMALNAQSRGLDVRAGAFEQLQWDEKSTPVQCIAMVQVIAHLEKPLLAIQKAYELLAPGGFLLMETWDRNSLTAKLFGDRWHEYSPPSVLHWFNQPLLQRMTENAGFEYVDHGRVLRWINVGHAKSLLSHVGEKSVIGKLASRCASLLPSKWDLIYPGDDLFWMVVRKR